MKGLCIAFAMYSKIPMPTVEWTEKNQKYAICYFPVVGAVLGTVMFALFTGIQLLTQQGIYVSELFTTAILIAMPIVITGGIHVDGYMDTQDALHSYQSKERKLEILKDSHIGAFAVIMLLLYYVVLFGAYAQIVTQKQMIFLAFSFVLSRCFSGWGVVSFKNARTNGMLYAFSSTAHKWVVKMVLIVLFIIVVVGMGMVDILTAAALLLANVAFFIYYRYKAYKEFGGVTGDLAGWYLQISELISALIIACSSCVVGIG